MSKNYVSGLSVQAAEARERIAAEKAEKAKEAEKAAEEAAAARGSNFIRQAAEARAAAEKQRQTMPMSEFALTVARNAENIKRGAFGTSTVTQLPENTMTHTEAQKDIKERFGSYPVNKRRLPGGGRRRTHAKAKGHRKSRRHTRRRAVRRTRKH